MESLFDLFFLQQITLTITIRPMPTIMEREMAMAWMSQSSGWSSIGSFSLRISGPEKIKK